MAEAPSRGAPASAAGAAGGALRDGRGTGHLQLTSSGRRRIAPAQAYTGDAAHRIAPWRSSSSPRGSRTDRRSPPSSRGCRPGCGSTGTRSTPTCDAVSRGTDAAHGRSSSPTTVEVLSGLRHGVTLGTPLTLVVRNRDHANWTWGMRPVAARGRADGQGDEGRDAAAARARRPRRRPQVRPRRRPQRARARVRAAHGRPRRRRRGREGAARRARDRRRRTARRGRRRDDRRGHARRHRRRPQGPRHARRDRRGGRDRRPARASARTRRSATGSTRASPSR